MTITKEDIIRELMTRIDIGRPKGKRLVESVLKLVKGSLASGEDVMISGFGEFNVRHKRARMGRNPKTKVEHEISERKVVTFRASKVFRRWLDKD